MCYRKQNLLYPAQKLGPLTKHHLKPRSIGGKCTEHNVSHIPEKLHQAWHLLFANHSATKIAHIINEHYLDPDYTMIAVHKDDLEAVNKTLQSQSKY